MGRVSRCGLAVFLASLLFSGLLVCCSPASQPTNALVKDFVVQTLPPSLQTRRRHIRRVQHGEDEAQEFCVFYKIENGLDVYTNAVMYRLDDEILSPLTVPLASLRPYTLPSPCPSERLCECSCYIESGDLLEGFDYQQGNELVIQDRCEDRTARAFFYHWNPDADRYESWGYFDAYDIHFTLGVTNRVTVDYQPRPGAEWVHRLVYRPCLTEGNPQFSCYSSECRAVKEEFVFYEKAPSPRDIRESPYPETILLGFYKTYSDWDVVGTFFTETTEADFCAGGRCGCASPPEDVRYITVTDMVVSEHGCIDENVCYEDHPESFLYDWAQIEVSVTCRTEDNKDEGTSVTWLVARADGGGWRLSGILSEPE